METSLLAYILLLPLAGAMINGLISFFGKDLEKRFITRHPGEKSGEQFLHKTNVVSAFVGVGVIFASFFIAIWCYLKLYGIANVADRRISQMLFTWIQSGSLQLDFNMQFDPLSALMVLVVTGIGALIHLYSVGYMHGDPGLSRYFCYLNFFLFAMLMLVLGNNLVTLFIGWEGVGLASYLLIGFWYTDVEKARAGKKAFITNRIGDFGFVLGILLLFALCSKLNFDKVTLSFDQIEKMVGAWEGSSLWLTIAALLLFLGACGKSAQIPLYVWLPDAMSGPTPVSALIHAATMVTAGVYMLVRLSTLYFASPVAMDVVAVTGVVTAFFAATITLVQNDIKKVLAYSTISQLGYMFLACGVGVPILAMFHLTTHAFFKACLFLCAGSVIHAMNGEQDIRKMGGLWRKMPVTFGSFLVASFAIAGFPPFSGFVSKDEIMSFAFGSHVNGNVVFWTLSAITTLLTSIYSFRLFFLTFVGKARASEERMQHLHESPFVMKIVLIILAVLAAVGGLLGVPHFCAFRFHNYIEAWLQPVVPGTHMIEQEGSDIEITLTVVTILITIGGTIIACCLYYGKKSDLPDRLSSRFSRIYNLLWNKYFVDEMYHKLIVGPLYWISNRVLFQVIDKKCIDGLVNSAGILCSSISRYVLKLQQGDVQYYLLYIVAGFVVFSAVIFFGVVIR